jgi:Vanadium chloroperoxidase N-terminal domain
MSHRRFSARLAIAITAVSLGGASLILANSWAGGPRLEEADPGPFASDAVLDWNAILLQANANDFDPAVVTSPDQAGPARTSRAFGIVHAAIFDAVNSIDQSYTPYLSAVSAPHGASIEAAVAQAAHDTMVSLYPQQKPMFDGALAVALADIPPGRARQGCAVGRAVAANILAARANDGSADPMPYTPIPLPGYHRADPLHPTQGYLSPGWGGVTPFVLRDASQFMPPDFVGTDPDSRLAWLEGQGYAEAFAEVKAYGAKFSTVRTADQTNIGIAWSYDGSPRLGTPPRLYNQIVRTIAIQSGNTMVENARLFGLVNLAMADAGVAAWDGKYIYAFWRPIVGIRLADQDQNPLTVADPHWKPLGAQADNGSGTNFTPPFPSYVSGHATFGTAMFQVLRRFYGTDDISFSFQSDEFNGVTSNGGVVRPRRVRWYRNLEQAEVENLLSRIYLGVHWRFDQIQGNTLGRKVGNYVFDNVLLPR